MIPTPVATPHTQRDRCGGYIERGLPRVRGHARCFAFPGRSDAVASDAVIICIISVCDRDSLVLFDLSSTYSYVLSYFVSYLDMPHNNLVILLSVSTPVGDSIVVYQVYVSCVVAINGFDTIF